MLGIFYFSSTGNSLYIAQRVKGMLGGQIKYIPNYTGDGSEFQRMILVSPIYSYGLPSFVYDLLPRLNKAGELVVILNYGGMTGGADQFVYRYARDLGLNIQGVFVLKMPENFTTTFTVPRFYIKSTLKSADKRIDRVADRIRRGDFRVPQKRRTREAVYLKNKSNWHLLARDFSTTDACTQCGKCVSLCPGGNIRLERGKIVFLDQCVACLGCYHRCPQKAIVYRKNTKKDRYINPNINEAHIGRDME